MRPLVKVKVEGLSRTLDNLKTMEGKLADSITKKATRPATQVLRKAVAGQIYNGLTRRTGLLASGLSVTVGKAKSGNRITGYVKMRQIATTGKSKSARTALKAATRQAKIGGRIARKFGAFYWRFLEFGVGQRETAGGANRGALPATGNVRGAFASASGLAIDTFRQVLLATTESEVRKLPTTKGGP